MYTNAAFASRDLLLPDTGMMQGRTLVVAWEQGLDDVGGDVTSLLVTATVVCQTNYWHVIEVTIVLIYIYVQFHLHRNRFVAPPIWFVNLLRIKLVKVCILS